MKQLITYSCLFFSVLLSTRANAQLFGKGKIITRSFDFNTFTSIIIQDFDGEVEIEIGKPYAIEVRIDENLEPRLRAKETGNNELKLYLEGNEYGKLYLENTHITIKISLPSCASIEHRGNTNVSISGISGHVFELSQSGNGNVSLSGESDGLDIDKEGNGNVNAKNLITKTAKVKSQGNGDVSVYAQISLTANGNGNGDILQAGPGKIETMSGVIGNGEVRKISSK